MKVSELYAQVAQLGFEDSLDSDKRFRFATERAIYQINGIRPHISSIDIVHFPPVNLLAPATPSPFNLITSSDGTYAVEAEGAKAFYFEVMGNGVATIAIKRKVVEDSGNAPISSGYDTFKIEEFDSSTSLKAYKGAIANPEGEAVNIAFESNGMLCLRSIALYDNVFSEADIPDYTPYTRYNLADIAEDFLAFDSPPVVEDSGNAPISSGYDIEGNSLLLSRAAEKGVYKVYYRRKPKMPSKDIKPSSNSELIDLDEELCSALPLLVASYIWLEDEPDRASYYKSLYNERIAEINQNKRDFKVAKIINTNGW